jgi:hypothetical protein
MASVSISPSPATTGDALSITGSGFLPSTVVTVALPELGIQSEITSDAAGFFGSDDIADHAATTLTASGAISADETVTLGAVTYTFKATVGATANEVDLGASTAEALANLKAAINLEAGAGTLYGSATVVHPTVGCRAVDATHAYVYAKTGGTGGNSLASTKVATNLAFPGATFNSGTPGTAATGVSAIIISIEEAGTFAVTASDGTNSATGSIQVFTS